MGIFLSTHTCDACGGVESRIFTDSWTGAELCLTCLGRVANYVTNSPNEEPDNLADELRARVNEELENEALFQRTSPAWSTRPPSAQG